MQPWNEFDRTAWTRTAHDHHVTNMTTYSLERFTPVDQRGEGAATSYIAKTLRRASESPLFEIIPAEHHASTLAALNWLDEPRVYRCGLAGEFPDGLRMPVVYHLDESPERITIWMEDVSDHAAWDLDRYHRTAEVLGQLNGRWSATVAAERFALGSRDVSELFFGKVVNFDLPNQADDPFWEQPAISDAVDRQHRRDLSELAQQIPSMLGELATLPRGVCHGDATPGNFLEPSDGTIVAIDWAFGNIDAIGSDLAQLLAGRFESGDAAAGDLGAISSALCDGYRSGLSRAGVDIDAAQWQYAWATHLAVRSVFSALMVEPAEDDRAMRELIRTRAALGRFGIDFARRVT